MSNQKPIGQVIEVHNVLVPGNPPKTRVVIVPIDGTNFEFNPLDLVYGAPAPEVAQHLNIISMGLLNEITRTQRSAMMLPNLADYRVETRDGHSDFRFRLCHIPSQRSTDWVTYESVATLDGVCALTAYYLGDSSLELRPIYAHEAITYIGVGECVEMPPSLGEAGMEKAP